MYGFSYRRILTALLIITGLSLQSCSDGLTDLERIKQRGELRVAMLAQPPMFFPDESALRGLDFQIVETYADSIGVSLDIIVAKTLEELYELIRKEKVDIAITDSVPQPIDIEKIHASIPYNTNQWYVIGNRKNPSPDKIQDISPGRIFVAADSAPAQVLRELQKKHMSLYWSEIPGSNNRKILENINKGFLPLTLINEDVYTYYRHLYPELSIALELNISYPSFWLTLHDRDKSLIQSIDVFLGKFSRSNKLKRLREIYFRHLNAPQYVDNTYFLERIQSLLPQYYSLFEKAAKEYSFDKRFLAAVSYQESHWNEKAVSMTGVTGLMMLTQETAKRVGIEDRTDPEQSVMGGAKYLDIIKDSLPKKINEPDRSWMTLAAYNIGLGHLEDARVITQKMGDDPNLWIDVEKHLPKLSQKKWYSQTKFGYARGHEPVSFVKRVHRYFDILRLYEQEELLKN